MDKNILVQYKGGGYDGCFWEWNLFYIDKNGRFEDVYSSGSGGIKNVAGLHVLDMDDSDVYVFHLDNEAEMLEFAKETNAVLVAGVVKWFNDHNVPDVQPFAVCSGCGGHIEDYNDIVLEDWHGCGGIASTADTLLCYECYSMGTCGCCGEYAGQTGLYEYEQDIDGCSEDVKQLLTEWCEDNGPACQWCWEQERDNLIKDEQEDLRWQSFTTGTPDIFSDEMRWLWV